jgi:hypothetical protein
MIDVTALFENAKKGAVSWDHKKVSELLRGLRDAIPSSRIDWEPGDEGWGRIIVGKEVALILNATYPVMIVANLFADDVKAAVDRFGVTCARVPNFEDRCLSADKAKLEALFFQPLPGAVDYTNLSAHDLWWATV